MKTLDLTNVDKTDIKTKTEDFVLNEIKDNSVKIIFDENLDLIIDCIEYYGYLYTNKDGYLEVKD